MLRNGSALVVLTTVLASCVPDLATSPPEPSGAAATPVEPSVWTFDDELARIAREAIPGFAGYYLDDGTTVILLVDSNRASTARAFFASERAPTGLPRATRIRPARFDFTMLKMWRDQLVPYIGRDDVFLLDIDEVNNTVRVGVGNQTAHAFMVAEANGLGIPEAAVQIQVQPPPELRVTLQDLRRPIGGGLQIRNGSSLAICTLGFNALVDGAASFLTASHCSLTQFQLDSSVEHQPNTAEPSIGNESLDPALTPKCQIWNPPSLPKYVNCRHSDASLFSHNGSATYERGRIMRTTFVATGMRGSLLIDEAQPYFDITSKGSFSSAPAGTVLDKVGRTSGWTRGTVTNTCVTITSNLWCQWVSSIWSEGGDSGSPIFQASSGRLEGILWGGPAGDFNTTYHSSIFGIQGDFGKTLSVCVASAGC